LELQELDVLNCFFKHRADVYLKKHANAFISLLSIFM